MFTIQVNEYEHIKVLINCVTQSISTGHIQSQSRIAVQEPLVEDRGG